MSRASTLPHVVIAGGGVAALEALIALRDLAGDRLRITLLAPDPDFVYRPMSVAEPFCLGHAARHPLADVARDFQADLVRAGLARVEPGWREAVLTDGRSLGYDSLLVAVGAHSQPAYPHAITVGAEAAPDALAGLLADLEQGHLRRVAFVVPSGATWSLPLYELAIMTARDAWGMGIDDAELTLVSPEPQPLDVFGAEPSATVAELLASDRIEFVGGVSASVERGVVIAGDRRIEVDRVVALPVAVGPGIAGLPEDEGGFLQVDQHCRVVGLRSVFAAGDVTRSPIKQGGLAAQQADAAAEAIAARHGADLDPQPFRPLLRGKLLTGGTDRWLRAPVGDTQAGAEAATRALWWPPTKIASKYLAPYLVGREEAERLTAAPQGGKPIARDLAARA